MFILNFFLMHPSMFLQSDDTNVLGLHVMYKFTDPPIVLSSSDIEGRYLDGFLWS